MPVLTGVQVARAIREREPRLSHRVVLIARNSSEQDVERLLADGFDAVLGKPFSIAVLNSVLSRLAGTPQRAQLAGAFGANLQSRRVPPGPRRRR